MENLHNTSPSLSTTDGLVQLTEDGGDQLHALWSIYTVRLEFFTWKSGKIVAKPTVKFACDGVRFCAVDVQVDRRSYSTKPLHGRGSPLDRGRFPFPIARGRCSRPADVAAIDETLTNRLWKMSRSPELNWQPVRVRFLITRANSVRHPKQQRAPRAGRVRLAFLKRKKRRRQHHYPRHRLNNIQIFPLILLLLLLCLLLLILPLQDLAPSRCGRRIVVMLWSPSVHLPAAVTDCHDPLDMDGSIICLLISSTGVLDSYIARLVSSSALIDEKLAANFYTTLTASAIQLVTALGKDGQTAQWAEVGFCDIGVEDAALKSIITLSISGAGLNWFRNPRGRLNEISKLESTCKNQPTDLSNIWSGWLGSRKPTVDLCW
ncbi:hypothetical protein T02_8964 [Trichinella nativa]|uniref:Uncharacterized protein n=1 Tax=Trichinella nativa TaxID=6335 RepID=A0A0V1L0A2_9BILA|nr:hypothetical protein T02_8964 [Trichinella nativa]